MPSLFARQLCLLCLLTRALVLRFSPDSFAQNPPMKTKPSSDVMIRLAPIDQNLGQPLEHPTNAASLAQLKAWGAVSDRIYIWGYM